MNPPPAALAWAAEAAGATEAQTVRRLAGGTHAATHLLRAGQLELVLRRFPPGDPAPAREEQVLKVLDGLGGWAPRLVAVDAEGSRFGEPAILITKLSGHSDVMPKSVDAAATQLGHALARIHATPLATLGGLRDGFAAATSGTPSGPAAEVVAAHGHHLADQEPVLTHYDFWSGNALWEDGRLTGIVDWSGASRAPRGFDVSWCRLDLVLLHGAHAAEVFLTAYEEAAGVAVPDVALWDLFALQNSHESVETWLPNYTDLGRTDLTTTDLRERHTAWTEECLSSAR